MSNQVDTITEEDKTINRRRKAYAMAKTDLGLTDEERHALASYMLRRDITSWKQLSDSQMTRLLDAMEGAILILSLYQQRP